MSHAVAAPILAAPILSLRGICKRFGSVHALDGVDLDVHAGEVVALVGDNGAGKSTLVKVMAGVHTADSGEYLFEGKTPPTSASRRSTRTCRSAATSTRCRTCSLAAS